VDVVSWVAVIGPITTLLGGLGGYWLAGRNEEARDRRAAARELAARQSALAEKLEEQRHQVQLDTLLELQDELMRLYQAFILSHAQDTKRLMKNGQDEPLAELSEAISLDAGPVTRLLVRLLDDDLRAGVSRFVAMCISTPVRPAFVDIPRLLDSITQRKAEMFGHYAEVNHQLGERLRSELDRRFLAADPGLGQHPLPPPSQP
jgi:hypothetical protein